MNSEGLAIERFEGAVEGQQVLRLIGPLTSSTTFPLHTALRDHDVKTVILDLTQVPYADSVGLGTLVGAYVSWQKAGKPVALSGANRRLQQLFHITKLDTFFLSFPTLQDAVAALTTAHSA